jgi:hypothetical protein
MAENAHRAFNRRLCVSDVQHCSHPHFGRGVVVVAVVVVVPVVVVSVSVVTVVVVAVAVVLVSVKVVTVAVVAVTVVRVVVVVEIAQPASPVQVHAASSSQSNAWTAGSTLAAASNQMACPYRGPLTGMSCSRDTVYRSASATPTPTAWTVTPRFISTCLYLSSLFSLLSKIPSVTTITCPSRPVAARAALHVDVKS